jgi:hypothetical protein
VRLRRALPPLTAHRRSHNSSGSSTGCEKKRERERKEASCYIVARVDHVGGETRRWPLLPPHAAPLQVYVYASLADVHKQKYTRFSSTGPA